MNKKTGGSSPQGKPAHEVKREVEREPAESSPNPPEQLKQQSGPYDLPHRRPA